MAATDLKRPAGGGYTGAMLNTPHRVPRVWLRPMFRGTPRACVPGVV